MSAVDAVEPVRTAQAGTVESMDCLVTITGSASGRVIEITGSSASRFKGLPKIGRASCRERV
mgnify:CR=1 FL=1